MGCGVMSMRRPAQGFTLIEILVAMALMFVVLLAAAPMFVFAMKETASAGDLGVVGVVVVDRMEVLRRVEFGFLAAGGNLTSNVTGYSDASNPEFTVRWQIADNASPATEKTLEVRAIATRRAMGRAKEITLVTLRAK